MIGLCRTNLLSDALSNNNAASGSIEFRLLCDTASPGFPSVLSADKLRGVSPPNLKGLSDEFQLSTGSEKGAPRRFALLVWAVVDEGTLEVVCAGLPVPCACCSIEKTSEIM